MAKKNNLPAGWNNCTLDDVAEVILGQSPPSSTYNENKIGIPFFQGKLDFGDLHPVPRIWCSQPKKIAKFNDVLLSVRAPVGSVNLSNCQCCIGRGLSAIRPRVKEMPTKFFLYFFMKIKQELDAKGTGSTFKAISGEQIRNLEIKLPPLNEQKKIVIKIEELFTELENIIQNLDFLKSQLNEYRKSILKAGVEGRLTESWRAIHGKNIQPASDLLSCLLQDRKRKWEYEQLKKQSTRNKLKNLNWKNKYKEPTVAESSLSSKIPKLPNTWKWITLDQITWSVRDGPHYSPQYVDEGIPFITGGNVRPSGVDFVTAKKISPQLHIDLCKRCKPEKGDILYTKGGTTGIARVNTYDNEFSVWVHVAVLKLVSPLEPFYVQHALNSPFCYLQSQQFTHGVGNQDLGLTRMIKIVLSLPPLEEQKKIIEFVDYHLSLSDKTEKVIDLNIQQVKVLRQSILKQAFEGKLIPQDPNDEPAEILLQKIKQEKQKSSSKISTRRKRK